MKYTHIMIRFGELSTKGKNKKDFIRILSKNISRILKPYEVNIETRYDHIYVEILDNDPQKLIELLQDVSGIHSLSLVIRINDDIDTILNTALEIAKSEEGKTFKIKCKRSNKKYPIISDIVLRKVAGHILRNTSLTVDVHHPDILISIEIRDEGAYLLAHTYKGAGGYPLGVGGKVMLMLSGGIDSPVAAYLSLKRGMTIECIHYASPPYTNMAVIDKLKDLLKVLSKYQPRIRLHIIPFTKIQETIYEVAPESYAITIMRRMMYRLASILASKRNCLAIANGESIGQVASQTLESLRVINEVTNFPIIRPCAVMDKDDIITISKKINTYDISIRPFEDCCTIFTPKNPKTKPNLDEVVKYESGANFSDLIYEAIKNVESVYITYEDEDKLF